jgi:3'-phosphoadenosine 5'-phosphosulfate sulfotransferase (PAPS reductase)/FAD synthetase
MTGLVFILISVIAVFVIVYRKETGENVYKYISKNFQIIYDRYAPYSFKIIREKVKDLGQEYTAKQYSIQIVMFAVASAIISYLYFYSLIISIFYIIAAVSVIPYLTYLRCKRLYSEFIFEQIQVYTTNTIMEFATTQSFVKSIEGVYESGVLEEPVKSDVKMMIDLAYTNGTIEQSLVYMNERYNFYIVKNMHL